MGLNFPLPVRVVSLGSESGNPITTGVAISLGSFLKQPLDIQNHPYFQITKNFNNYALKNVVRNLCLKTLSSRYQKKWSDK